MCDTVTVMTDVKCSLGVLKIALKMINPAWAKFLDRASCVSQEGTLVHTKPWRKQHKPREQASQNTSGYNIVIPSRYGKAPGEGADDLPYSDLGFKKGPNGEWIIETDKDNHKQYLVNLPKTVATVIGQIRTKRLAAQLGGKVESETLDVNAGKATTVIIVERETNTQQQA